MSNVSYFQHPLAVVESTNIGEGTRIWAFAHVLPRATIGRDCNICDYVFIENDVVVGDRVTIKSGVQLWDGVVLEDDTFIGPNATFSNDRFPRGRMQPDEHARTTIRTGASIGANATILPGLTVGRNAIVGAGAVVMHDVPPNAILVGNPAHITGYVDAQAGAPMAAEPAAAGVSVSQVRGVTLHRLPHFEDLRGGLTVAEGASLPFIPKRYFVVHHVPNREVRGEHAHRALHQLLTCVHGQCSLMVDDGTVRQLIHLDSPDLSVHIAPLVWGVQLRFSADAVLVVLASDQYDPADYIRDYDEYRAIVTAGGRAG